MPRAARPGCATTPFDAKLTAVEFKTHGEPFANTPSVPAAMLCQAGQSRNQSPPARTAMSSFVAKTGVVCSGREAEEGRCSGPSSVVVAGQKFGSPVPSDGGRYSIF